MRSAIKYRAGYKYQLLDAYTCSTRIFPGRDITTPWVGLNTAGMITLRKGYASDGPSGPTIDTKSAMRGSFIHDAGYALIRAGLMPQSSRKQWDELYERICIEDGMSKIRAWVHFKALRAFGWKASDPESESQVLTAP